MYEGQPRISAPNVGDDVLDNDDAVRPVHPRDDRLAALQPRLPEGGPPHAGALQVVAAQVDAQATHGDARCADPVRRGG